MGLLITGRVEEWAAITAAAAAAASAADVVKPFYFLKVRSLCSLEHCLDSLVLALLRFLSKYSHTHTYTLLFTDATSTAILKKAAAV